MKMRLLLVSAILLSLLGGISSVRPSATMVQSSDASVFEQLLATSNAEPDIYGPLEGSIPPDPGFGGFVAENVIVEKFVAHVFCQEVDTRPDEFRNCGLQFFDQSTLDNLIFLVGSAGEWLLLRGTFDRPGSINEGQGDASSIIDGSGTFAIDMALQNGRAYFGINGQYLTAVDVFPMTGPFIVAVASASRTSPLPFSAFSIWSLEDPAATSGAVSHEQSPESTEPSGGEVQETAMPTFDESTSLPEEISPESPSDTAVATAAGEPVVGPLSGTTGPSADDAVTLTDLPLYSFAASFDCLDDRSSVEDSWMCVAHVRDAKTPREFIFGYRANDSWILVYLDPDQNIFRVLNEGTELVGEPHLPGEWARFDVEVNGPIGSVSVNGIQAATFDASILPNPKVFGVSRTGADSESVVAFENLVVWELEHDPSSMPEPGPVTTYHSFRYGVELDYGNEWTILGEGRTGDGGIFDVLGLENNGVTVDLRIVGLLEPESVISNVIASLQAQPDVSNLVLLPDTNSWPTSPNYGSAEASVTYTAQTDDGVEERRRDFFVTSYYAPDAGTFADTFFASYTLLIFVDASIEAYEASIDTIQTLKSGLRPVPIEAEENSSAQDVVASPYVWASQNGLVALDIDADWTILFQSSTDYIDSVTVEHSGLYVTVSVKPLSIYGDGSAEGCLADEINLKSEHLGFEMRQAGNEPFTTLTLPGLEYAQAAFLWQDANAEESAKTDGYLELICFEHPASDSLVNVEFQTFFPITPEQINLIQTFTSGFVFSP